MSRFEEYDTSLVVTFIIHVKKLIYIYIYYTGRFLIGLFQGSYNVLLRTYLGETSEVVISMLPKEQQAKSTIKYTNFFISFVIGSICVAIGPGQRAT